MLQWTWGCRYPFELVCWVSPCVYSGVELLGHKTVPFSNFFRNLHHGFHSGCTILHSYQQCRGFPFLKKFLILERERGREKHRFVVAPIHAPIARFWCVPDWRPNPQPLSMSGQRSSQLSHAAGAGPLLHIRTSTSCGLTHWWEPSW